MTAAVTLRGISKRFPGVLALDRVDFEAFPGEVHSIVGLNGAGKSTLVKLLAGQLVQDEGSIWISGRAVAFRHPSEARRQGITVVHQEVALCPSLNVGRNVLLGMEGFWVRRDRLSSEERERVSTALAQIGGSYRPETPPDELSIPELRLAQIARALVEPGQVIVLDEPTAVLGEADADSLLDRLSELKEAGETIVYVTHRLREVLAISDRITVLRDGERVGTFLRGEVDRDDLIELMAPVQSARRSPTADRAEPGPTTREAQERDGLRIEGLTASGSFQGVDLAVQAGQITGVVGVPGAGQSQLARCLAGLLSPTSGKIFVDGQPLRPGTVEDAFRRGVVLVPADRRGAGVIAPLSFQENIALPIRAPSRRLGFRRKRIERARAEFFRRTFDVDVPALGALARYLSGGNQQKLAIARAVEASPRVLVLEEPTQGIDVHSKVEVLRLIRELATESGTAVVLAGSEIEEILGFVDDIHVLRLGRVVGRFRASEVSLDEILQLAVP